MQEEKDTRVTITITQIDVMVATSYVNPGRSARGNGATETSRAGAEKKQPKKPQKREQFHAFKCALRCNLLRYVAIGYWPHGNRVGAGKREWARALGGSGEWKRRRGPGPLGPVDSNNVNVSTLVLWCTRFPKVLIPPGCHLVLAPAVLLQRPLGRWHGVGHTHLPRAGNP